MTTPTSRIRVNPALNHPFQTPFPPQFATQTPLCPRFTRAPCPIPPIPRIIAPVGCLCEEW